MNQIKINWKIVTKSIRDGKCVLFIGSEIFTSDSGKTLADMLPEFLRKEGYDKFKYYQPDNLFHFDDISYKSTLPTELGEFFEGSHPHADYILKKIVDIPFPLILSLNTDQRLPKMMEASGTKPQFGFYWKNKKQPGEDGLKPSKSSPVIYNLFGSVTHAESLVLTYEDLFSYIQSLLQKNTIPDNILSELREATSFLFLGVPLNSWYVRLLLRVMSISSSSNGLKYAYNLHLEEENTSFFSEQFNINVIFSGITKFVDELHENCEAMGLIGRKDIEEDNKKAKLNKVKDFIGKADIDKAFNLLDEIVEDTNNPEIENQLFQFRGRQSKLEKDKNKGTLSSENIIITSNAIMDGLLQFVDEILEVA